MSFKEINIKDFNGNFVKLFDDSWSLISAGDKNACNTMTASWGAVGELWNTDVCFIFIRPQRYTKKFVEEQPRFTVSFFDAEQHGSLAFCGSNSGRDCDKFEKTGLTPYYTDGTVGVEQAKVILVCKKIAQQDIDPSGFIDAAIDSSCYPEKDYHRMYIGAIEKVLIKE